jgi:hypothetical protein
MSKIYFSRSISRTLSADHPVGDPTGGAAYGEKNDPVSAIFSLATMGGTYAAATGVGMGIGATFSAMTVMQGITFAGAALNLVGNITGNKTLQKVGMIAGIAGGLGQLAGIQGPTLGQTFGGSAPVSSSGGTAAGAMSSKSGSLSQSPAAGSNVAAPNQAAQSYAGSSLSANTPVSVNAPAVNAPAVNATAVNPLNTGSSYTGPIVPAGTTSADLANYAGPTVPTPDPSIFSKAWETTKDIASGLNPITNPYGAMAVGQIAQPIAEYLSGKTDAEIDALEAQTGYADARAMQMQEEIAREKRRRENLNAGYAQVNTGINVNPAVLAQAQAGGLISGAMQPAA